MASLINRMRGTTPEDAPSRLIRQQRTGIDALKRNRQAVADSGIVVTPRAPRSYGGGVADPGELMRDGQRGLVYVLLGKLKTHNPEAHEIAAAWWEDGRQATITKVACSAVIDRLRANLEAPAVVTPVIAPPAPVEAPTRKWDAFTDIPTGNYALDVPGDKIHFYRVTRSRDGRYVNVSERASDELYPVRPWVRAECVLKSIRDAGPRDAAILFGRTIGRCYRCHRSLTDDASRAMGIGPDCAGKGGF